MITVLEYLVIAAAIGLVVFFVAAWVFGRGEQLAALPARTSPAELPDQAPAGDDIRKVRFAVGVRGYRMGDVDWTLDRLAGELDRLRGQVRELGGDPDQLPEGGELVPENEAPQVAGPYDAAESGWPEADRPAAGGPAADGPEAGGAAIGVDADRTTRLTKIDPTSRP